MNDIERYINRFSPEIQERLYSIREIFYNLNPNIIEKIRYSMPSYKVGSDYLYIAAFKNHISLYAVYKIEEIEDEVSKYRGKGTQDTLHFFHNKPIPFDLINLIICIRMLK